MNHIGGSVVDQCDNHEWYFNGIYGFSEEQNKRKTWLLIQDMVTRGGDRVICFGDLKDVVFDH